MITTNTLTQTIQFILAPVVMITACGILLNGLLLRYAAIDAHLREIYQEQNRLLEMQPKLSDRAAERLQTLDYVLSDLLHRHHLIHDGLLATYWAILTFMLDMLVIALGTVLVNDWLFHVIILVLLVGVGVLLLGMARVAQEFQTSHQSIQVEVDRNCRSCLPGAIKRR
jgi:uncharacterized circularly permuted ATP-grasp superfamily protein